MICLSSYYSISPILLTNWSARAVTSNLLCHDGYCLCGVTIQYFFIVVLSLFYYLIIKLECQSCYLQLVFVISLFIVVLWRMLYFTSIARGFIVVIPLNWYGGIYFRCYSFPYLFLLFLFLLSTQLRDQAL